MTDTVRVRWDALPRFPILWQLRGWESLPLVELLQRVQQELRAEAGALTSSKAAGP